jgi:DNA-binding transcriptional ArsR family regulator
MADIAKVMKALASGPRLKILRLLKGRTLCVNAITRKLGITQSAVSQHLRILRNAGLIMPDKHGYWIHYSVNANAMSKCAQAMKKLFSLQEQ